MIKNTVYNNNDKKANAFYYYNETISKHSITIIIPLLFMIIRYNCYKNHRKDYNKKRTSLKQHQTT